MPFFKAIKQKFGLAESSAAAEKARAEAAAAADAEEGLPASQVENLVVVEHLPADVVTNPLHRYSHPHLYLSAEHLQHMNVVEILAVGHQRAYWKRDFRKQLLGAANIKAKVVELFLAAQSKDENLHDEPDPAA